MKGENSGRNLQTRRAFSFIVQGSLQESHVSQDQMNSHYSRRKKTNHSKEHYARSGNHMLILTVKEFSSLQPRLVVSIAGELEIAEKNPEKDVRVFVFTFHLRTQCPT